jgi:cupin 2 domain-containing protein
MRSGNIFIDSDPAVAGEKLEELLRHRNLVVERIVSADGSHPAIYVQTQDEWVLLVRGLAVLRMEGKVVELTAGDYVFIPAGMSHTVERTSGGAIWLAVHLYPPAAHD